jgi:hypothetical protein
MKRQIILLLPVDQYDRTDDAEHIIGMNFSSMLDIGDRFRDAWLFSNFDEFLNACNDQEINLELYWITYVNII